MDTIFFSFVIMGGDQFNAQWEYVSFNELNRLNANGCRLQWDLMGRGHGYNFGVRRIAVSCIWGAGPIRKIVDTGTGRCGPGGRHAAQTGGRPTALHRWREAERHHRRTGVLFSGLKTAMLQTLII
jgi:hypothetical protein